LSFEKWYNAKDAKTQNNTKAMPPRRKAPHGLPKDTTHPGRTRPARPRFCVFAFMYFVPRRLSCGTAEETGVPRRRPEAAAVG
jgi:hypothetical protein